MRGRRKNGQILGIAMIVLGFLILFAKVLPAGFWWFCIGAGLVIGGFCLLCRR